MINDIEHLFIYLLAIFIYFGKISGQVFYPFFFFRQGFTGGGGSENKQFPFLAHSGGGGVGEREGRGELVPYIA